MAPLRREVLGAPAVRLRGRCGRPPEQGYFLPFFLPSFFLSFFLSFFFAMVASLRRSPPRGRAPPMIVNGSLTARQRRVDVAASAATLRRVAEGTDLKRFERAVDALRLIPDPLLRLDAVRAARERLEVLEVAAVRDARQAGATWKAIGALYGLSKQGAQQRFRATSADEGASPGAGPRA